MNIQTADLPTLSNLSTAHWPTDQQNQFAKAVDGIASAEWFVAVSATCTSDERHHLATAFAFAAFSHVRNRMRLAPDEELMLDGKGRAAPGKSQATAR